MEGFDNIKEVFNLVSGKKFEVQFYDKDGDLTNIKEMNIPDINLYLMGKDTNEISITIVE